MQFDFIVRYPKYSGYEVFYLQNITDIDERIINRFKEDMESLGNTSVDKYARATDHIDKIVDQ